MATSQSFTTVGDRSALATVLELTPQVTTTGALPAVARIVLSGENATL